MDQEDIRAPDSVINERLIDNGLDREDIQLNEAILASLKDNVIFDEDEELNKALVDSSQDNVIFDNDEELNKAILASSHHNESYRRESLSNFLISMNKLKLFNNNETIQLIDFILNDYINCNIDDVKVDEETYKKIFNEFKTIRIKDSELEIIKNIFVKI
jgi:hypothetical protein